jgi:putative heme-binding domain-containing protein
LPSRQVSPIFRATTVVQKDGQVHNGLVVGETSEKVTLLLPDASRREILQDDVFRRDPQETSPMPGGLVKTPEELRDLLAYLLRQ